MGKKLNRLLLALESLECRLEAFEVIVKANYQTICHLRTVVQGESSQVFAGQIAEGGSSRLSEAGRPEVRF